MSHFQNKNKIWINNTLKSNAETLDILKLLKDIGIFKEKSKKRKPKSKPKEEFEDEEEFLVPPTGGGGGGSDMGGGSITSNLLALKGALSAKNSEEENIKKLKEATELQLGKLRDAQQDLTRTQERRSFGFRPSAPRIEQFDEEDNYFPPKEGVVSEPSYEFTEERSGTDNPQSVMDKDISPKVSPSQGQIEDIDEEEYINPKKPTAVINEYQLALDYLKNNKNNIKRFPTFAESNKTKYDIYIELLDSLGYQKPKGSRIYKYSSSSILDPALRQLIIRAYRDDMDEVD